MNSLQSKEDVELFQMHNMKETDVQHYLNYDHINVKAMCPNGCYQLSFLRFINNTIFFCFYIRLKVMMTLFVTWFLSSSLTSINTFFHLFIRLKMLITLFVTKWHFFFFCLVNCFFTNKYISLYVVQEIIDDEVIAYAILSWIWAKRGTLVMTFLLKMVMILKDMTCAIVWQRHSVNIT